MSKETTVPPLFFALFDSTDRLQDSELAALRVEVGDLRRLLTELATCADLGYAKALGAKRERCIRATEAALDYLGFRPLPPEPVVREE